MHSCCRAGRCQPANLRPAPHVPSRPAAATAFAATVDAAGASTNYWLARWLLRDVVAGLFPARVHAFALEVRVLGWGGLVLAKLGSEV